MNTATPGTGLIGLINWNSRADPNCAGLFEAEEYRLSGLNAQSRVLAINTEGATDPEGYSRITGSHNNSSYLHKPPGSATSILDDEGGYQFWLEKLSEFNGDFVHAVMVKALIVRDEYRSRFPVVDHSFNQINASWVLR